MILKDKNILIVDDEAELRSSLSRILKKEGANVYTAASAPEALEILPLTRIDAVLCDLVMPEMDGITFLKKVKAEQSELEVIMLTAHGSIEIAVVAMREGAYDFITKPFKRVTLLKTLERALEKQALEKENKFLRNQLAEIEDHRRLIGESEGIRGVKDWINRVAPLPSTVLITGESGTGKELVAREIHNKSPRRHKRFVAINCAAIPENLFESELFGHVRGAFTGAVRDKEGLFKTADGGTLFLDEISNIPVTLQIKLLRVIEEKEILPVGSTSPQRVDVRIIAASNRDLLAEVEAGRFREDLYFRLNVVGITIPPLRERRSDIPMLVDFFLKLHNRELGKNVQRVNPRAMSLLMSFHWKGNVRELDNVVERALILCDGEELLPEHLPVALRIDSSPDNTSHSLKDAVRDYEKNYILQILKQTKNDKQRAAELLGLSQSSLYRKMSELGIPTHFSFS